MEVPPGHRRPAPPGRFVGSAQGAVASDGRRQDGTTGCSRRRRRHGGSFQHKRHAPPAYPTRQGLDSSLAGRVQSDVTFGFSGVIKYSPDNMLRHYLSVFPLRLEDAVVDQRHRLGTQ